MRHTARTSCGEARSPSRSSTTPSDASCAIKFRAGPFDRPYADPERERATIMKPEYRTAAREIAARSMVLLKNDDADAAPVARLKRLAVIGALADDRDSTLGNWTGDGRPEDAVTVLAGLRAALPAAEVTLRERRDGRCRRAHRTRPPASRPTERHRRSRALARAADATVLVIGETGAMSGEATSRTSLDLPGRQIDLAREVIATGKPVAVVLMNGRPLSIPWLADQRAGDPRSLVSRHGRRECRRRRAAGKSESRREAAGHVPANGRPGAASTTVTSPRAGRRKTKTNTPPNTSMRRGHRSFLSDTA